MPPRGVTKGTKRARQYEHIKESQLQRGAQRGPSRGDRRAHGEQGARPRRESRARARDLGGDISSGRRGGLRSGTNRPEGAHARPALQRGAQARHRGALEDEQGAARASRC